MINHVNQILCFLCALCGFFSSGGIAAQESQPAEQPNIIFILADDLGYHELGSYGQEKIKTPNLDRLAEGGMRFTQHYSGSPVCAPSRSVLMIGQHTGRNIIRGNKEMGGWGPDEPEGQYPLPAEKVTIAEILKEQSYTTGAFGKWGLGGPGSVGHPNNQGFDYYYGYLCQRVAHNYYPTHLWRNHDVDILHGNDYFKAHQRIESPPKDDKGYEQYSGSDYAPEKITDEAIAFIAREHDQPFFLYYASVIPHVALQAPQEFIDQYPIEWDSEPYLGQNGYLPSKRPRATYAAMITYLDYNVGRLINALEEHDVRENTIIIFTSDNGTTFNGGVDREFFNSLGNWRGHKCTLYEGGIRVPLIVNWPGQIEPGSVSDHISAFQDWLPTFVELTNAEKRSRNIDGVSLLPTLLINIDDSKQVQHDALYFEYPESNQQQAVRAGEWKAVRTNLRDGEIKTQLYNLESDPSESTDVAADHSAIVQRLEQMMDRERVSSKLFLIDVLDR